MISKLLVEQTTKMSKIGDPDDVEQAKRCARGVASISKFHANPWLAARVMIKHFFYDYLRNLFCTLTLGSMYLESCGQNMLAYVVNMINMLSYFENMIKYAIFV